MKQNTNQIFKAEDLDWKELEKNGKTEKWKECIRPEE